MGMSRFSLILLPLVALGLFACPPADEDLMQVPEGGGRIAIAHNYSIAYGRAGHVVVLEPNGEVLGYSFAPGSPEMAAEPPDPTVLREAIAQTQEAHRMFYSKNYHWK